MFTNAFSVFWSPLYLFGLSAAVIVLTIFVGLQFAALECFSIGDGLLWEDAWFYAASDFLMDFFPPLFVIEINIACKLNGLC